MNKRNILPAFLVFWLIINLIQAFYSGLLNDEAYYFFYSRDLAWGYYDHPPFIALFIKMGYALFHNELGVRIFYVILSTGTLFILYKLAEVKNDLLFVVLSFSFMIFQITGFLALPDSLLLFLSALFFLVYRKYSKSYGIREGFLLGLVMAGLIYSKYLGVLVIFFTLLSDPRLLLKRSFWLAVLVTSSLLIPHLLWQYRNDFPSVYYHFTERSHDESFRWFNFAEFIIGQAGQMNPILFIPVILMLIKFRPSDRYERALLFTAAGILLLPFLFMIKGRVEANWTMAGLIPVFLVAFRMFEARRPWHCFLYITGGLTFILIIAARIVLIADLVPERYARQYRLDMNGWKEFSERANQLAGDRPVVFVGTYQNPSQYIFYTGRKAFSFNNAVYRSNQYDLEGIEESLQGKEAMIIFPWKSISAEDRREFRLVLTDSIRYPNGKYRYVKFEENYRSYNFIPAVIPLEDHQAKAGSVLEVPVVLKNPYSEPVQFNYVDTGKVFLTCFLLKKGKPVIYEKFEDITRLVLDEDYRTSFRLKIPEEPGTYYLRISIKSGWLPPGINSRLFRLEVS